MLSEILQPKFHRVAPSQSAGSRSDKMLFLLVSGTFCVANVEGAASCAFGTQPVGLGHLAFCVGSIDDSPKA